MKLIPDTDNPIATNRRASAFQKESEQDTVDRRECPVDLRTVAREHWGRFMDRHVTTPPRLLDGFDPGPLPPDSIPTLEDAVARYQGIDPASITDAGFCISMTLTLQLTGKAWSYVPAAAEFLTGFVLDHREAQ